MCSFENLAGNQIEPDEVSVEDYTNLIRRYRLGEHGDASRTLSRWNRVQVNAVTSEFRKGRPDPVQIKAAAMLHTEVVLRKLDASGFHLNHTKSWVRELEPPERENFEPRWLRMLGYFYFQSLGSEDMTAIAEAKESFPDDVALHLAFGNLCETSGWMRRDADAPLILKTLRAEWPACL